MYFGYADGKKLSISCGMCTSQRADRFYLYGTEGTLEAPIPYNAKGALHYSIVRGDVVTTKTMQVEDNYKLEIEQLGRCVLNGEKPWVSHRFSIENAKIIDRVWKLSAINRREKHERYFEDGYKAGGAFAV